VAEGDLGPEWACGGNDAPMRVGAPVTRAGADENGFDTTLEARLGALARPMHYASE